MDIASAEGSAAGERLPRAAGAVVIGGGIVGVATADHLAEAGVGGVVLLEREHGLGLGSTGRCAGGFRHQFSSEVNVRLSLESVRMIRTFTATHGLPLDVHVDGYLFLSRDDATWEGYRAAAAMQRRLGARVELLDAAACTELVPGLAVDDVVGATFGPDDGIADPSGLVNGYATLARRAGVTIVTGVTVTALSTSADGGRVTGVETSAGAIASPLVCVAAGVWSRALCATAGVELPVEPHPRQLAQTTDFAGRPAQRTLVVDTSTMFFFHREGTGVLMGLPPTRDDATFSTAPDPAFLADELLPVAVRVLPAVEAAGLATTWVGLYEMTPDHHPLIGRIQAVDGLLVATGYSGHGFQHGPITGRLLAEIATTGAARTVDIHALRPERFAEGQPVVESFVV
jgi:glycine/D-amino acid oxidase-like deaminating enzyme